MKLKLPQIQDKASGTPHCKYCKYCIKVLADDKWGCGLQRRHFHERAMTSYCERFEPAKTCESWRSPSLDEILGLY